MKESSESDNRPITSSRSAALEMRSNVHALVQDTYDADALVRREVENEMLPRRIDPKTLVDFIVESPELGIFGKRLERTIQRAQIGFRLTAAPGDDCVIPYVVQVHAGPRPECKLSHAFARDPSLR